MSRPTKKNFPFAHTFSIVAYDPQTGDMGVAVQSHWFSVGSLVTWAEAGVGAIATQAMVNVSYGPDGLQLLREGNNASTALQQLITQDEQSNIRQAAIVDAQGHIAAHTGEKCILAAGHYCGKHFSVQANMMLNDKVWPAMAKAFENSTGALSERMLQAMQAAQYAGGDIRGQQSAAILIVSGEKKEKSWQGVKLELRVEDHPAPIDELARLLKLHQAYELMNSADEEIAQGDFAAAKALYVQANALAPEITEISFWHAVALAEIDQLEAALPIFKKVFAENPNWATLLQRLPDVDLFSKDATIMQKILAQK
ncbi:MAG: DUF1028 domain-containing protein [Anaerolineaceae bacterium]|nr:DUF1028 domain-containing protein [Anaerolineaceae bacterium]